MANSEFNKLRIKKVSTGEIFTYYEDQVGIEIDGDGMVSICCPDMGGREFLLNPDELKAAQSEVLNG